MKKQAINYIERDEKRTKMILKNIIGIQKTRSNVNLRRNLLEENLNTLELNEINVVQVIQQAQNAIKENMIDPIRMDQMIDKNKEIQFAQKEINQGLASMNENEVEQDVQQMMKQLETEIFSQKNTKTKFNSQSQYQLNMEIQ